MRDLVEGVIWSNIEREWIDDVINQTKLETAEHILAMWNEPWPVTQNPFIDNLKAYIEELK
jgi:hypothetical protein